MVPNRTKSKLLSGQPAFGVSMMIPSPQIVKMVGRLGFDWILIDCEHGDISLEGAEELVRSSELVGITPIARPKDNNPADILQLLDRGAMGVQVPHVNTADDARNDEGLHLLQNLHPSGIQCQVSQPTICHLEVEPIRLPRSGNQGGIYRLTNGPRQHTLRHL